MAVFRDKFLDDVTNWLKIFIDASKTSFRLSKLQQEENKSSYFEISKDGDIRIRRQMDTMQFEESTNYTDLTLTHDGNVIISVNGESNTVVTIDSNGINMTTDKDVNVTSDGNTSISTAGSANVIADSVSVESNMIDMTAEVVNIKNRVNIQELHVGGRITSQYISTSNAIVENELNTGTFIDDSLRVGDVNKEEFEKDSQHEAGSWLNCVETVKAMLASKGLKYSQSSSLTYNFNGFSTTVHPDCSGTVTAMISMYTGRSMSQIGSSSFTKRESLTGFTKMGWSGWGSLQTGDIIARDGHVEVFAYSEGGHNYVWNAGSDSSVQSAGPTISGHDSYTTVWRPS